MEWTTSAYGSQKSSVLTLVLGGVLAQVAAGFAAAFRGVSNSIKLMVPHDGLRAAGIQHMADEVDCFELLWASIDEVTHEDYLARGMAPSSMLLGVGQ